MANTITYAPNRLP